MKRPRGRPKGLALSDTQVKAFVKAWLDIRKYPTTEEVGQVVGISSNGARSLAKRLRAAGNSLPPRKWGPRNSMWWL